MPSTDKLREQLRAHLLPGETVLGRRSVVASGKVEQRSHDTSLALLGPSVYACSAMGSVAGQAELPDKTNLVVMTDRRLLWCHKGHLSGDVEFGGADFLAAVSFAKIIPARIALAKLAIQFHGGDRVQFDLPSDNRAAEFAERINDQLAHEPAFDPPAQLDTASTVAA